MNTKGITIGIVTIIVSVILITGVLIPVISNATQGTGSVYTNTGNFQYKAIENENETHEITIALNNQIVSIDVDGTTAYQTSITDIVNIPIIYGDCFVYFINKETDTEIVCNCYKNFGADLVFTAAQQ